MKRFLAAALAGLALMAAGVANATDYLFQVDSPGDLNGAYSFVLPSSPTVTISDAVSFTISGMIHQIGPYGPLDYLSDFTFFTEDFLGGFQSINDVYLGDTLFTGPTSAPTFRTGVFTVNNYVSDQTVTISAVAVPEPAAWIVMTLGVGLVGAALRRRRVHAPA